MSNVEQDFSTICTSKCDDCGRKAAGTEFYSHGSPVYFVCKSCEPKAFEKKARTDIDHWLNGGEIHS